MEKISGKCKIMFSFVRLRLRAKQFSISVEYTCINSFQLDKFCFCSCLYYIAIILSVDQCYKSFLSYSTRTISEIR